MVLKKSRSGILCYSKTIPELTGVDGKVGNNGKRPTYLRRVVQHLIPTEVKTSVVSEDRHPVANHVSNLAVQSDALQPWSGKSVV